MVQRHAVHKCLWRINAVIDTTRDLKICYKLYLQMQCHGHDGNDSIIQLLVIGLMTVMLDINMHALGAVNRAYRLDLQSQPAI